MVSNGKINRQQIQRAVQHSISLFANMYGHQPRFSSTAHQWVYESYAGKGLQDTDNWWLPYGAKVEQSTVGSLCFMHKSSLYFIILSLIVWHLDICLLRWQNSVTPTQNQVYCYWRMNFIHCSEQTDKIL